MNEAGTQTRSLVKWPQFLGPPPGLKEINLMCWAVFGLCIVAPMCFFMVVRVKSDKYFQQSPVDFVYFYGIGEIANSHPAADVYNYDLQLATFNGIVPLHHGKYGPSPYPPFVAQFFRPFAMLSFRAAYFAWMFVTFALYVGG
ncbi:MAG TPA: hypothetical protein VHA06_07535, partial [Candidatus Angelobacter sp.]|nr:hypothetical protein [Candidatus Angelobacter sp.]